MSAKHAPLHVKFLIEETDIVTDNFNTIWHNYNIRSISEFLVNTKVANERGQRVSGMASWKWDTKFVSQIQVSLISKFMFMSLFYSRGGIMLT